MGSPLSYYAIACIFLFKRLSLQLLANKFGFPCVSLAWAQHSPMLADSFFVLVLIISTSTMLMCLAQE